MPKKNALNNLTGAEWLYWTDTVYMTNYPVDATHRLRKAHGAMKPPELMSDIIRFFTRVGETVLDPFAGVGGTLLGAALCGRSSLGFDINPRWVEVYHRIQQEYVICDGTFIQRPDDPVSCGEITGHLEAADCLERLSSMPEASMDAIVSDPPYGCNHATSGFAGETNFNMFNYDEARDFGNSADFNEFYRRMHAFALESIRILRPGRYMVLIVGDRYQSGEFIPLGVRTADVMREAGFQLKGIKVWSNKATQRPLKPYAVLSSFVPNITHQNILILRKPAGG